MTDLFEQPEQTEALLPIATQDLGGGAVQTVNARALHGFLRVKRDFSNWIKDRIEKYNFLENQDFVFFAEFGENPSGGRPRTEYALTLDMAKELAMVENNDQGRTARRYFIAVERRMRQAPALPDFTNPIEAARAWADQAEARQIAETALEAARVDQAALQRIEAGRGDVCLTDAAKILNLGRKALIDWLIAEQWIYRRQNGALTAYRKRENQGLVSLTFVEITRTNGDIEQRPQVKITPKGVGAIAKAFAAAKTVEAALDAALTIGADHD